ncbi:MAG: hypothetical protein ACKPKO_18710, partial [Candidatus Fonsibacter sp.]
MRSKCNQAKNLRATLGAFWQLLPLHALFRDPDDAEVEDSSLVACCCNAAHSGDGVAEEEEVTPIAEY